MITFDIEKPEITDEIRAMIKNAPKFSSEEIAEIDDAVPGKLVARGFAQFKEYINSNDFSKLDDPTETITIHIPKSQADKIRKEGDDWTEKISRFVSENIANGRLA